MIVDYLEYVRELHRKTIRKLKFYTITDKTRAKLERRAKHTMTIMAHYARMDRNVYTFNLNDIDTQFGKPFSDFLSYWNSADWKAKSLDKVTRYI